MTELDLDAIRARAEAATEGPWTGIHPCISDGDGEAVARNWRGHDPDTEFIAHARTDVPALIAEVVRLSNEWGTLAREHAYATYDRDRFEDERDELLEEVERLREEREGLVAAVSQLKLRGIEADGDAIKLRNTLDHIREALVSYPTCGVHDSDEITCGWKRAVKDAQNVLETRHV